MPDKPRPYKGQNPRVEDQSDEYSTWHDLNDPSVVKDKDPEAPLDPDEIKKEEDIAYGAKSVPKKAHVRWWRI